jgi:hypothetical protein
MKEGLKAIIPNPSEDGYFLINYDAMTVDWLIRNLHTIQNDMTRTGIWKQV